MRVGTNLSGPWLMHLPHLEALARAMNVGMAYPTDTAIRAGVENVGGVGIIDIAGRMAKYEQDGWTSTVNVIQQFRAAEADPSVKAILLRIESPGGLAAGTKELADAIASAGKKKPVHAYMEDLGASAAYWAASQAHRITINAMGMAGAVGTYGTLYDYSGAMDKAGIKVHVLRAGKFKGAGTPGSPIDADLLAEVQRQVNELNEFFLNGVASGRKMSRAAVNKLADGRVHMGQSAVALGLVDAVATEHEVLVGLLNLVEGASPNAFNSVVSQSKEAKSMGAKEQVDEMVQELVARGMPREQAHLKVMRENPQLREQWVREHNEDHGRYGRV